MPLNYLYETSLLHYYVFIRTDGGWYITPAPPAHLYNNVDMDQLLILQK